MNWRPAVQTHSHDPPNNTGDGASPIATPTYAGTATPRPHHPQSATDGYFHTDTYCDANGLQPTPFQHRPQQSKLCPPAHSLCRAPRSTKQSRSSRAVVPADTRIRFVTTHHSLGQCLSSASNYPGNTTLNGCPSGQRLVATTRTHHVEDLQYRDAPRSYLLVPGTFEEDGTLIIQVGRSPSKPGIHSRKFRRPAASFLRDITTVRPNQGPPRAAEAAHSTGVHRAFPSYDDTIATLDNKSPVQPGTSYQLLLYDTFQYSFDGGSEVEITATNKLIFGLVIGTAHRFSVCL